jgi:hypothetical protein
MSRCFPYPPPGYEAGPKSEHQHNDMLKKVHVLCPLKSLAKNRQYVVDSQNLGVVRLTSIE